MKVWPVLALLYASLFVSALAVVGGLPGGLAKRDDTADSTGAASSIYDNGVLIATRPPNVPEPWLGLVQRLPSASSADAALRLITDETTTVLVDQSALSEVPVAFLRAQLDAGISLIGLNITAADLMVASQFREAIAATSITGSAPAFDRFGPRPDVPFYSKLSKTGTDTRYNRSGAGQKWFSDRLFRADLEQALYGVNADIGGRGTVKPR